MSVKILLSHLLTIVSPVYTNCQQWHSWM